MIYMSTWFNEWTWQAWYKSYPNRKYVGMRKIDRAKLSMIAQTKKPLVGIPKTKITFKENSYYAGNWR